MGKIMLITFLLMGLGTNASADITTLEGAKKACDVGNATGCLNLGNMYYNGKGVRQSSSKAKALFGKACDGKEATGCKNYAILNLR